MSGIVASFALTGHFEFHQPESFCRKKRFQAFVERHVAELRKWRDSGCLRVVEVGDYLCKRRNGLGGVRGLCIVVSKFFWVKCGMDGVSYLNDEPFL